MATRIVFALGDRSYEAVSFTEPGTSVDGDTMISRTDGENGGGLGEEEGNFLWERRAKWPEELKRHALVLIKWRHPDDSRLVRYFDWSDDEWDQDWHDLDFQWHDRHLVLRRCT